MCILMSSFTFLYVIVLANTFGSLSQAVADARVRIKWNNGIIIGKRLKTLLDRKTFYAFYGIPYAEPPVGDLRFQPPVYKPKWNSTFDATKKYTEVCPQPDLVDRTQVRGREDCLYLNVYTPYLMYDATKNPELDVLVWIHGYGFSCSVGHLHGPDFLIENDLIVVTLNYRLGALGFLNVGNSSASGNMGVKDIIMALSWIQDNIRSFAGNPNSVTVFGSDTGATLVSLMLISPLAKGLFAKAIIQSGSAFTPDIFKKNSKESAERLLKRLSTKTPGVPASFKLFQTARARKIVLLSLDLYDGTEMRDKQRPISAFGPSIDADRNNGFMMDTPERIYKFTEIHSINIPIMIGYNSKESIGNLAAIINKPSLLNYINFNFEYLVPFRGKRHAYYSRKYIDIAREIRKYFFLNSTISKDNMDAYINYVSDLTVYPLYRTVREHMKVAWAPIFLYRFSYDGNCNVFKRAALDEPRSIKGASNGDEICYLFKCAPFERLYRDDKAESDRSFIRKINRLWSNFAKYGNPTPQHLEDEILEGLNWKPTKLEDLELLDISADFQIISGQEVDRIKFWDELREKYYIPKKVSRVKNEL